MSLVGLAVPIIGTLVEVLQSRRQDVAKETGVSEKTVGKVGDALQAYLAKDERALKVVMGEIERARQHDVATGQQAPPVVELLRGLVRPVITLTAFS